LIANSYVFKSLYLIIQEIFYGWNKNSYSIWWLWKAKEIILRVGVEVAGTWRLDLDRNGPHCKTNTV
jgi:hypothetical protein